MPSLPDFLNDPDGAAAAGSAEPAPADVLASVKAEGGRRRARRHRRNAVLAGVMLVVLAVPAVALLPGGPGAVSDVNTAGDGATPSTAAAEVLGVVIERPDVSAVSTPTTAAVAVPTVPATAPVPTTARPAPTTPALVCRNSTDPACGPFRWDPAPAANEPLAAAFTSAPTSATVGQQVVFGVQWSDADANLEFDRFSADGVVLGGACSSVNRYGPWDRPGRGSGAGTLSYPHTFTEAGTYTVTVALATGVLGRDCADPYASEAVLEVVVTVTAA